MKTSTFLFLLLFQFLLAPSVWAETPLPKATFNIAEIDAALSSAVSEKRVVGAVVVIAEKGRVVYRRAAGLSDRETGTPATVDTIFRLASVTKPLVSVAAMKLVDQGKLSLEDPVSKWLPDFRPAMADGSRPEITIRQLLTHTSGLSYGFNEPVDSPYHLLGVSDGVDQPKLTMAENLARLASAPLLHQPGTAFKYSLATDVLGAVIARVTGEPLQTAMRTLVLDPLAMANTGFTPKDAKRLATPYANSKFGILRIEDGSFMPFSVSFLRFEPSRTLNPDAYPSGGGGMVGTADEFVTFLEAVRRGGAPLLKSETAAQMMKDQLPSEMAGHKAGWGFTYGWSILRDPVAGKTPQSKGTLQWGGVYGNSWFVDPAREITVVVLTNTAIEGMAGKLPADIRAAVYRAR